VACDINPDKLEGAARVGDRHARRRCRRPGGRAGETVPEGLDYVFDAIGRIETTEQAIAALGLGGAAVIVGLPPIGASARFHPAGDDRRTTTR